MIDIGGMTTRPIQEMVLALSMTFMVPWIGGIAGALVKRFNRWRFRRMMKE